MELENPYKKFLVHTDVPEVWKDSVLVGGGKHYGHLEVDIQPMDNITWEAKLKPVYVFPLYNIHDSAYSSYERRIYADSIGLIRSYNDIFLPIENLIHGYSSPGLLSYSKIYPNPFKTETTIEYYLLKPCYTAVKILNTQGKVLRIMDPGLKNTGMQKVKWDGKDTNGNQVTPGIYFYSVEVNSATPQIHKLILLK